MAGKAKLVLPYNTQSVNKAGPIDAKPTEYSIAGVAGLRLRVFPAVDGNPPTGVYVYRYSIGHGDRREFRRLKLGRRDALKLADARDLAEEHRRAVAKGVDVSKAVEVRRTALTFGELADACLSAGNLRDSTKRSYREALNAEILREIGKKVADEVTPDDVAAITRRIAGRGSLINADRTRTAIAAVYKYGRAERLATSAPARGLAKVGPSIARDRILSTDEIVRFWRAIHAPDAPLSCAAFWSSPC